MVVGSGAREHALTWKLLASPRVDSVICVPGNPGMSVLAHTVAADPLDADALLAIAREQKVDFTVVGPEAPLAAGIVDHFQANQQRIFGPTRAAARLESSKVWTKGFLERHGIPTARAKVVDSDFGARQTLAEVGYPAVIKADGLAGGKGVWVAQSAEEADQALDALFGRRSVGSAADRVLIEQHLRGRELSVLAFTDGERVAVMPPARDYKRLLDGDLGPNTGGMGGYTRPEDVPPELMAWIEREVLLPTVRGMAAEGAAYRGVLYAGLMLTPDGPSVLEFNCRFGDPEAQIILPLLESDLFEILEACVEGRLEPARVRWGGGATCGVVLAAEGYPESPRAGDAIEGLEDLAPGVMAFHAGTATRSVSRLFGASSVQSLVTAGGRVLTIVATGPTLAAARAIVYENVDLVSFKGKQCRTDIGLPVSGADTDAWRAPSQSDAEDALPIPAAIPGAVSVQPQVLLVGCNDEEHALLREAAGLLTYLKIGYETRTVSAYYGPADAQTLARGAVSQGFRAIVAVAGTEPTLPGLLAAWSLLPVVAVARVLDPEQRGREDEDVMRAATLVPDGAPVAVAGLGVRGARTAAWLIASILGVAAQSDTAQLSPRTNSAQQVTPHMETSPT